MNQIDPINRTIRLNPGETKNDEGRMAVMTDEVHTLISACVAGKRSDDYVLTRNGNRPVKDFRERWDKLVADAGCGSLLFHDLRRSAVRNMVRSGIPEVVAMRISGHKTRAVFDRYNIVSERDLTEAARKLEMAQKWPKKQELHHNRSVDPVEERQSNFVN